MLSDLISAWHALCNVGRRRVCRSHMRFQGQIETDRSARHLKPILVIEDDVDTRDAYVEYLEIQGFTVAVAASGAEALQRIAAQQPSAILLDLSLADCDGREIVEHLSRNITTRGIAVAVISGYSLPPEERAQFMRVFTKPVDFDHLVGWLREVDAARS